MGKNDEMRMTRAAAPPLLTRPRLLMALLLGAAGLSAFAQAPAEAPASAATAAPEAAASAASPPPTPKPVMIAKPTAPTALATPPANWSELTPGERLLLAPLERDWPTISPQQRSKWLSATPLLVTLSPARLARVHDRMRDWARMTPAERVNARIGFQLAKQVDADEREAKWEAYQALSPEQRQALADKAAARRKAQATAPRPSAKPLTAGPKSNVVPAAPRLVQPAAVTGGLMQAKPGATTVPMTRDFALPSHHAAGQTKVVGDPDLVDPMTLLPKSLKARPASSPAP